MEKPFEFEMLAPFPQQTFTGGDSPPPPGGFTALLIADDTDDDFDLPEPTTCFLPPPPETLESLIPLSLLSGGRHRQMTPAADLIPRKRALEQPTPEWTPCLSEPHPFQIPMLRSPVEANVMPTEKVLPREIRSEPAPSAPPTLESVLNGFSLSEFVAALLAPTKKTQEEEEGGADRAILRSSAAEKGKSKAKKIQSAKTCGRRRRITEKVRCLGKLLPGEKKMTTATILQEAHRYILFLQAQIEALRSMPVRSAYGAMSASVSNGRLGWLSRQELLQVVVNSPGAQAVLCSDKCCVVSAEQVAVLRNMLRQRLSNTGI